MKDTTKKTFKSDVIDAKGVILLDVWAPWCGPCRGMEPILDQVKSETEGWAQIVKLDASTDMDMVQELGVSGLPTYIVFKDGQPVSSLVGAVPKHDLMSGLQAARAL